MSCAICHTRRPRRFCPGVRGEICTTCCGTEREVTVSCPLDCEFLVEARKHERQAPFDPDHLPNEDIRITERFLEEHEELATALSAAVLQAGLRTHGAVDSDVAEALEALIRTNRTLQNGIYYESLPENTLAATIYRLVQEAVANFRQEEQKRLGLSKTRDADVLAILVFLQRLALGQNNGRKRGRAFLSMLASYYGAGPESPSPAPSLILP